MDNEPSKRDVWVARAKAWGTVVAAVGGLLTAAGALFKPRDDSATKAAYTELANGQERLSSDVQGLAADVAAMRGYLAAKQGEPLPAPQAPPTQAVDAGAVAPTARTPRAPATPPSRPRPAVISLGQVNVARGLGTGSGGGLDVADLEFPPPPVHAAPAPVHPADFSEVLKSAK
jgi:hypothetical protein